jgi:hypothetical protein
VEAVVLSSETGLLEVIKSEEEETGATLKIKCLLQWKIAADSIISLESQQATGTYKVEEYKHVASGNDFYTEAKLGVVE